MKNSIKLALSGMALCCSMSGFAAEAWRFGLQQAKISAKNDWTTSPSFAQITAVGPAMAHVKATESNYSTQLYTDAITGKMSKWNKQNTTFVYKGKIFLEGGKTYKFAKYLDDAALLIVGGKQLIKNDQWKDFPIGSYTPTTTGWYDFDCRVGDGTGGKGPTVTDGKWSATMGLGYTTANMTGHGEEKTDLSEGWVKLANTDENPGAVFRVLSDSDFVSVVGVAAADGGYNVKVTAVKPGKAVIYYGASLGTVEYPDTWDASTDEVEFTEEELEKNLFFPWTENAKPCFAVKFSGQDSDSAFLQWSDAYNLTPTPQVTAAVANVQPTQVTVTQNLSFAIVVDGETPPDISVMAYYDATDKGTTAGDWTSSQNLGVCAVGESSFSIEGLTAGADYVVRLCLTAGSITAWSDPISFSTGGVFLSAPTSLYESDPQTKKFTVSRPETSTAEELVVYLTYSDNVASLVSELPASVTIPAGSTSTDVTFTMIDNATADGDSVLTIAIAENASYVRGNPYSADVAIVDDESIEAQVCVWTGAAGDAKWSTANNWSSGRVPTIADTACFGAEGIPSDGNIIVDTEAIVKELKFATTAALTLTAGDTGGALVASAITRVDVDGTEGDQMISAPLKFYPQSGTDFYCFVEGSGALRLNVQATKAVTDVTFVKTGSGSLYLMQKNTIPSSSLKVLAGEVKPTCSEAACGSVVIGGGDELAQYNVDGSWAYNISPQVYTNGKFQAWSDQTSGGVDNFQAHEGGYIYFKSTYGGKYDFWGGSLKIGYRCWSGCYTQHITVHKSDLTARMEGSTTASTYYDYSLSVEDGASPIDFIFNGGVDSGSSGHSFNISGAGTMQTLRSWDNSYNPTVKKLTWLMDNASGAGSGRGKLTIGEGATLRGVGRFGGNNVNQVLTVNGTSSSPATLAPGSMTEAGEPVYGTFTVGTESVTNTVTVGANAMVRIGVGRDTISETGKLGDTVDKLLVNGAMSVAEGAKLKIAVSNDDLANIRGGTYEIVRATQGIAGNFSIEAPKSNWHVAKVMENDVCVALTLSIPTKGLKVMVR